MKKSCGSCAADATEASAKPETSAAVAQTMCPVMDKPINKSLFVDYKGKRVYLCCGGCVKTFNADPEKYLKKMADAGVTPEDVPAADAKK